MVSLMDGDEAVKMGKRAGNAISLDSLVADIGPDATRILSLMSSLDQASTFDLATVREQSVENPVFYVQMASARIGGVAARRSSGAWRGPRSAEVDLSLLTHPRELELIRCLEELPEVVADAAVDRAPTKVTTWVRRLAGCFHGFYHDCPILADEVDPALTQARLWLVEATAHRPGHRPRTARGVRAGGDVTRTWPPTTADDPSAADPTDPVAPGLLPMTAVDRRRPAGSPSVACDLVDLAEQFGTPLFVYDEAHLRARCREAVEAWGDGVAYATKAFLCVAMARLAHEEGMCLDVSTGGELHVALTAGVPADRLVLHGNNKSEEELAAALAVGVGRIVVDSFDEIDRLERLVPEAPVTDDPRGDTGALPAPGPGPDHPGGGGPHPRVRAHRPGRLQVRVRAGLGGGGPAPWTGCRGLDREGTVEFVGHPRPPG